MKILILGNGFDLAHKLPTTYNDFLSFFSFWRGGFDDVNNPNYPSFIDIKNEIIKDRNLDHKISNLVISNIWLKYFKEINKTTKENWLDFESEIFKVVKLFESSKVFGNEIKQHKISECFDHCNYNRAKDQIINDLNSLTLLLEIYIKEVVSKFPTTKIDFFEINKFDKVLSFNYSNTYRELYNSTIDIDFIHGEADYKKNNNMVIGIEETLSEDENSSDTSFIDMKKYFQRIDKQTGSLYKKWLSYITGGVEKDNEIHIFGHSLDTSDGDVLSDFFSNEIVDRTKIFIYYHTDNVKKQHIKNLVKVLGKERLINLTSSVEEKIKFVLT